ncbi:phospho-N-acetylmuramoyl-pentapeptide-transferase [Carbonactinospora thermoautotrophica]|uniref:Phospho-N-acetylmuramoyl-pentapeptide-transferase n=1 Tax=Carbonactinospora thermoautotrophica TaxID=1469144 RepID=A0A132MR48_9ACTN|nr:phospho-N-acetylmuramoyl-pentapeptide-transferase [Carbonactinospora thermoautotrophica]KWX00323.1 phospho-N-acetylmuramoyl-pentapeptide-transferase [Carbonactinospora thermoautotrophica]KWX01587.1 Phospho-N-acetylmuramoyl-pentapeptide-transferase [Carbonactinospora thermoautotrophica]KWX08723.1 phospho-N-acetylmuramoyl-pentapeptide-transferase [Carbonactinospora thermoautotrophica]MCX9190762.1 phospho-N-acetylmuramoyl-pentapeptide-transferase [Carbonactinospora thermoautotrophica]
MRAILLASGIALILSLFGTPLWIRFLVRRGYGQEIRDDGPTTHQSKRGTPTMGGTVFILAAVIAYFAAKAITGSPPTMSALLVLFLTTGLGVVGFVDDAIKIFKQRSLGLRARAKLAGQLIVSVSFAILALFFHNEHGLAPASTAVSFIRDTSLVLGPVLFVVWAYLLIAATSNGVNLTDGLDGLATGASVMVFAAYTIIGAWQYGQSCPVQPGPSCYEVRDPLDLAVVAAALMGACFGFLWWNASPAKIFMGDTGSLALGGALAGLAITTRTELLLVIIGGLFVIITASVIIQVSYFKMTGKRVFRMAPLQHHFELKGWNEVTIVIRFWIIAGICVAFGVSVFYAEWLGGL